MGPSGSGKSTLLHCLAGILVPDAGEVWYGGQRLDSLSDARRRALRRAKFGFVFQSGQLVPERVKTNAAPVLAHNARSPSAPIACLIIMVVSLSFVGPRLPKPRGAIV